MNTNPPPSPAISNTSTISPLTATANSPTNAATPTPANIRRGSVPTSPPARAASASPSPSGRPPSLPTSPIRKPRARELLRQHYGLNRTPSGGDIAGTSGSGSGVRPSSSSRRVSAASVNAGTSLGLVVERSNNPLDLDSPAFDPKAYYQQLITGSSIVGLLHRENELLTEIRQLDSERQSLVYNHHHELIEASDTIAAMRTRAESLEGDLDKLKAAFSEISRLTSELSAVHKGGSGEDDT